MDGLRNLPGDALVEVTGLVPGTQIEPGEVNQDGCIRVHLTTFDPAETYVFSIKVEAGLWSQ